MGLFRRRDWKSIRRNFAAEGPTMVIKFLMWPVFPVLILALWWDVRKHGYTAPPEDRV